MNIFYVSKDPLLAARMLCDQHVIVCSKEAVQMLCAVYRHYVPYFLVANSELYASTHANHPCTKWVRSSSKHYAWLTLHAREMFAEYTRRFGKVHKSEAMFRRVSDIPFGMPELPTFFDPPQVMPEQYQNPGNTVAAYRAYYIGEKLAFARWFHSEPPYWCAAAYEKTR